MNKIELLFADGDSASYNVIDEQITMGPGFISFHSEENVSHVIMIDRLKGWVFTESKIIKPNIQLELPLE